MDIFASVARLAMLNGRKDCTTNALTELKVGDTALQERKWLYIMNASGVNFFIGSQTALGTTVTVDTIARQGIKMPTGDAIWLPVSDNIPIYAMPQSGNGKRLRIAELS